MGAVLLWCVRACLCDNLSQSYKADVQNIIIFILHLVVLSVVKQKKYFLCFECELFRARPCLAGDVSDTLATHSGHVCDVTDTGCWSQDHSIHAHIFTSISDKLDGKSNEKLLRVDFFLLTLPVSIFLPPFLLSGPCCLFTSVLL